MARTSHPRKMLMRAGTGCSSALAGAPSCPRSLRPQAKHSPLPLTPAACPPLMLSAAQRRTTCQRMQELLPGCLHPGKNSLRYLHGEPAARSCLSRAHRRCLAPPSAQILLSHATRARCRHTLQRQQARTRTDALEQPAQPDCCCCCSCCAILCGMHGPAHTVPSGNNGSIGGVKAPDAQSCMLACQDLPPLASPIMQDTRQITRNWASPSLASTRAQSGAQGRLSRADALWNRTCSTCGSCTSAVPPTPSCPS